MTRVSGSVKGLVARAQREAQRRAQNPSTAHLLLVMLQSGDGTGRLLSGLGVREGELLTAIRAVDAEPASALERAVEHAYRIAKAMGSGEVLPAHLLFSIARDGRSAAHRSLEQLGTGAKHVQEAVMSTLRQGESVRPALGTKPSPARPSARRVYKPTPPQEAEPPATETRSIDKLAAPPRPREAIPSTIAPAVAASTPSSAPVAVAPLASPADEPVIVVSASSPFSLEPRKFRTLCSLGRNLTELAWSGGIDEVIGRDEEIEQLLDVLARRRSNNPLLVGPPGVGKTAIVEGLALRVARGGEGVTGLESMILVEVSAGALVSGTGVRGALSDRLRQIRLEVERGQGRIVLFIDEVHALFTGGDAPDDLAHELKAALARGDLPCIGATTYAEYRKYIERDPALARRFSAVHVAEPSTEDAIEILQGIAPRYEVHHGVTYEPAAVRAAVEMSVRYLPEKSLPDKAISLLDLAGARLGRRGDSVVGVEAIAKVVAEKAQVPLERLLVSDAEKLIRLEEHLAEHIVGHGEVMRRIADALRKGAAGFHGRRPLATFLFLGPTGVGKTETARVLNELFFCGSTMTHIDMSELSEAHAVAKLVGAPPGYVGHDAGGQLTEAIRHRPYQLVLLDEIEKAHVDVLQSLLPLLEDGRLTDGKGRTVDCTNTIIVMTSNLGAEQSSVNRAAIGFQNVGNTGDRGEHSAMIAARKALPPELWNRIDEPLFFGGLCEIEVAEIARRMLAVVVNKVAERHDLELVVDPSTVTWLVERGGYDAALGARPMRRMVGRVVEAQLATGLLSGDFRRGDRVRIFADGDVLALKRLAGSAEAAE